MKIAKLISTPIQTNNEGILNNYYPVPDNYGFTSSSAEDVTTLNTLYIFYEYKRYDCGVYRDSLRDNLVQNWNSLSFDDRKECIRAYRYPSDITQSEWDTYFTEQEHEYNWNQVCVNTRESLRLPRLFAAFQKVSYRCTEVQTMLIYLQVKDLCYDYYYANLPHLLLWIQNGSYPALGIDYTNNGFAQMDGYTTTLRDELLDIFING